MQTSRLENFSESRLKEISIKAEKILQIGHEKTSRDLGLNETADF